MISKPEMELIYERLWNATKKGKVDWIAGDSCYKCSFPKSSAIISEQMVNFSTFYQLSVLNDEAEIVGELGASQSEGDLYEALGELYTLAEANALKINATIKDILDHLE